MIRNLYPARSCAIAALAAVLLNACADPNRPPERIILIVADTLRQDAVSAYGGWAKTPNLDALAERGQLFPSAVASYHQTTMSMAAMFTGRTPSLERGRRRRAIAWHGRSWCGVARLAKAVVRARCIPDEVPTLAELLRDQGYRTIGVVSNALLFEPFGIRPGFDEWVKVGKVPLKPKHGAKSASIPTRAADKVNAAVGLALDDRRDDHFFLYVHYMDVHDYRKEELKDPRDQYRSAVERLDAAVGELIDLLEERDLIEDSLIVFTSDHGERLGEAHQIPGKRSHRGNPSFEELLRVPLIVSPARFDTQGLARSEDLFRMILEAAGVRDLPPSELDPGELFVSEANWQTYRRGKWKSYRTRIGREGYLYDLEADPGETRNVGPENKTIVRQHRRRVSRLAKKLGTKSAARSLTDKEVARLQILGYFEDPRLKEPPQKLPARSSGALLSIDGLLSRCRLGIYSSGNESALVLNAIKENSYVWDVGFRNGDRIRSVAGYRADSATDAKRLLNSIDARVPVTVGVERAGERIEVTVPPDWK